VEQRPPAHVLVLERPGVQLHQPLQRPDPPRLADHVVQEQQPPARPQHPPHLGDGAPVVGDATQHQRADNGVERRVGQVEILGVAEAQIDLAAEPVGPVPGQLEHLGAEVDAGQADVVGVVGEVPAGADGDLEDVAAGLAADPASALGEEPPFPAGDLLVVGAGVLVPVAAQPPHPPVTHLPGHAALPPASAGGAGAGQR
jgi:hypothetical protein